MSSTQDMLAQVSRAVALAMKQSGGLIVARRGSVIRAAPKPRPKLKAEKLRDRWMTPRFLGRLLEDYVGGPFELDVAADASNTLAPAFITREQDALSMEDWPACRRAFLNPPFSDGQLLPFIQKAIEQVVERRRIRAMAVVTLADVSTRYWRALTQARAVQVQFEGGRWTCDPPPGVKVSSPRAAMQAWVLRAPLSVSDAIEMYATDDERRVFAARRSK